jgi:hypothetical protein
MSDLNDPNSLLLLGEIRGQLRELIHVGNNNAQKIEALGARMSALEIANANTEGGQSVWREILRSPSLGWLIGSLALLAWAFLTGKLNA